MKRLLLLLVLLPIFGFSQMVDPDYFNNLIPLKNDIRELSYVLKSDAVNKDRIYTEAKKWFMSTFNDGWSVIQIDDRENSTIVGKAYLRLDRYCFFTSSNWKVTFNLEVKAKDNRYRIRFYDISALELYAIPVLTNQKILNSWSCEDLVHLCYSGSKTSMKQKREVLQSIYDNLFEITGRLRGAMKNNSKDDDW